MILLSLKIERRTVGAAIFHSRHLENTRKRELSSDSEKASRTLTAFIRELVETHHPALVAIEIPPQDCNTRRLVLTDTTRNLARSLGVPIREVTKHEVFEAFTLPPCKNRKDLRSIVARIFPSVAEARTPSLLDAAALGLYVQTKQLLTPSP
jgi:hypothetical protein